MIDTVLLDALDVLFLLSLGYYLITNLQWYNYSLYRVVSKHHKWRWHLLYFVLPIVLFVLFNLFGYGGFFYLFCLFVYIPMLFFWAKKLDKPLKWTGRVFRFYAIYLLFILLDIGMQMLYGKNIFSYFIALAFSLVVSNLFEYFLLNRYKKIASEKIASMSHCKIVLITASYGKTSIKNYLTQILKSRYMVHSTPRSVNTLVGIIADINTQLDSRSEFYIVEAGARQKGDIAEIAQFLNPQYVIIGKLGEQHLEYFKSFENIVETKYEALQSNRLRHVLVESSNPIPQYALNKVQKAPMGIKNIVATLSGTKFELEVDGEYREFETPVLGTFNAYNIALAILMAKKMGMSLSEIGSKVKKLNSVEHRLCKSEVNGRIILDDSFNGNLEGMLEAIRISSEYQGRKIIVTPGIVESTEEANIELAKEIDKVFEIAIITGELNSKILSSTIERSKKILLKEKGMLENTLKATVKEGDLILFANDAPSYI